MAHRKGVMVTMAHMASMTITQRENVVMVMMAERCDDERDGTERWQQPRGVEEHAPHSP